MNAHTDMVIKFAVASDRFSENRKVHTELKVSHFFYCSLSFSIDG